MSLLQRIKFLLLVRVEQRPDLRSGVVHHGLGFLHRIFGNGDDLRPSLIDDRLNLRLLIGREIQRLGQVFEMRLANWFAVFIRLSQKWCAPIGRDELLKRIFAK